jgi:bifunctional oligoribonuclease and PAP phosphatase NrnA
LHIGQKTRKLDPKLISSTKQLLESRNQPIVIVTHTHPDGDAIGSSLGLFHCLSNAGYAGVNVIVPDPYPSFLQWLPGNGEVVTATLQPDLAGHLIREAALIFCLDFNDLARTNGLEGLLRNANGVKILVDHHPQPEPAFDVVFSYPGFSSTAEMIFKLLEGLELMSFFNRDAAACLYAGIVTDTGSFSYSCNNPETYRISARLIESGVDGEKVHRLIYNTYSADRMRLLGYCLSEKLVVLPESDTAYISLTRKDLERFNHQVGDTEGVVNYALSIENISLAALFTEHEDHIKVSFRSAGKVDVNLFARDYFQGGGHRNAAGGKSFDPMDNTLARFEQLVKNEANRHE